MVINAIKSFWVGQLIIIFIKKKDHNKNIEIVRSVLSTNLTNLY